MRTKLLALVLLLALAGPPAPASARAVVSPRASAAATRGRGQTMIVEVPGLGPLLLAGRNPRRAIREYVQGLNARHVFNAATSELREWGAALADRPQVASLAELRTSGRPIVGIQLNKLDDLLGRKVKWSARNVAEAVRRANGVPVFLPPGVSPSKVEKLLGSVDHLVLCGGADVHPQIYRRHVAGAVDPNLARDRSECRVVSRALGLGLGVDGICRGAQLLNVALGGTLVQDLRAEGVTEKAHRGAPKGPPVLHAVTLEPSSFTAVAIGQTRLRACSQHHQAVETLGRGLHAAGHSCDGVVELIESADGQARGYQFHPEVGQSRACHKIFMSIVERAAKRAAESGSPR